MKKSIMLTLALLLFSSCSTMQSVKVSQRTRFYKADFQTVFKAVLTYCNENSFPITMADKGIGIINTDFKENDGSSKLFIGTSREKLNFSINESPDVKMSSVIIIASIEERGNSGSWIQARMTESDAIDLYKRIFDNIQSRLGR